MMKYEDLVNKRYKEPEDEKFEDATKEILETPTRTMNGTCSGYTRHLADTSITLMIFMFFSGRKSLLARTIISDFSKFAKIRVKICTHLKR